MFENNNSSNELLKSLVSENDARAFIRDVVRKHALSRHLQRPDILKMSLDEFNQIIVDSNFDS